MEDTINLLQKTLKKYRPANASNRIHLLPYDSDQRIFYNNYSKESLNRNSFTPTNRTRSKISPSKIRSKTPFTSSHPLAVFTSSTKLTPVHKKTETFRSQQKYGKILPCENPSPLPSISVSPARSRMEMRNNTETMRKSKKELYSNNSSAHLTQLFEILNNCIVLEEQSIKQNLDLNLIQNDFTRDFKDLRFRLDAISTSPEKLTEQR